MDRFIEPEINSIWKYNPEKINTFCFILWLKTVSSSFPYPLGVQHCENPRVHLSGSLQIMASVRPYPERTRNLHEIPTLLNCGPSSRGRKLEFHIWNLKGVYINFFFKLLIIFKIYVCHQLKRSILVYIQKPKASTDLIVLTAKNQH